MSLYSVQKWLFIKVELIKVAVFFYLYFLMKLKTDKQVLKLQAEACFMLLFVWSEKPLLRCISLESSQDGVSGHVVCLFMVLSPHVSKSLITEVRESKYNQEFCAQAQVK